MQGAETDQAQCLTNFHNHIIKHQWYFSAFVGGNPRKRIQLGQPKRRTNVRADFGLHWFYQKLFPSKIWSSLETWSSTEWCKLKIVMFMYCSQDTHDILTAENTTPFFFFFFQSKLVWNQDSWLRYRACFKWITLSPCGGFFSICL